MLMVDRNNGELTPLAEVSLPDAGLLERQDLQRMICNSPDAFFGEMGENLLLIGEEVQPTDFVEDRIDLLAIDQSGAAVVIELKRGSHKLHLLQAVSYAAMISKWGADQFIEQRAKFAEQTTGDAKEEIEQFLDGDLRDLNEVQRIVLVAEDYDYQVLVTAEWLSDTFQVDIRCYRLELAQDGPREFLGCTCIFPPPEISEHAIRRGRRGDIVEPKWATWEESLAAIQNPDLREYFERELAAGRDNHLGKRLMYYRVGGKRRFFVSARNDFAYVWQYSRFPGDEELWRNRLDGSNDVEPVSRQNRLRFYLRTKKDFETFDKVVNTELDNVEFHSGETLDGESNGVTATK